VIEQHDYEFLQTFWTRRAIVAYSVFAFNILIFILMTIAGGSENDSTLLAFGAKANWLIQQGEVWRFVTPIFLHIGWLHLLFNSYALWIVGPQVEKLYGGARFLLLYLLTGIAGVAASYWFHPGNVSAGASGAIFGLFGVLLVFSIKYRKTIPAFFSQALGKGMLQTLAINLAIGFLIPQIDTSAHIGGVVAGCALAFALPFARPGLPEGRGLKLVQAALVILIAASFFGVMTHYNGPSLSLGNLGTSRASIGTLANSLIKGEEAFENSESVLDSGDLGKLPEAREDLGRAIDVLKDAPTFSGAAGTLSRELLDVLQKQYGYLEEVEQTGRRRSDFLGISPQSTRYERLKRRIDDWFETQAPGYRNVR
jgi:membrane associated rhomboid family serine protease